MSSERLDNIFFYSLEKAIKTYRQFAQRNITKANFDITIDQWLVLKTLKESPAISQQELAVNVFKDLASITRILDLLIDKGYLTREPDAADRRRFKLTITKGGHKILDLVQPLILSNRATALKGISKEEVRYTREILDKIITNTQ